MRKLFLLLAMLPALAWGQQLGGTYSRQEIDFAKARAGITLTGLPNDWGRITTFAREFMQAPFEAGNDGKESRSIWTGYSKGKIPDNTQAPIWQARKALNAAYYYKVKGDTAFGNRVGQMLSRQVAVGGTSFLGSWPAPGLSVKAGGVAYEVGMHEATWLATLASAYDYVKDRMSPTARTAFETWYVASATWLAGQIQAGPIGQNFPNRLLGDYSILGRDAKGSSYGIFISGDPYNITRDSLGRVLTHIGGFPIAHLAMAYSNRVADKEKAIMLGYAITGNSLLGLHTSTWFRESLIYDTYLDGTTSEWQRGGDAGRENNQAQGYWYNHKKVQAMVMAADIFARKGDFSLYEFTTTAGRWGTEGSPRSLKTMLDRIADTEQGVNPQYVLVKPCSTCAVTSYLIGPMRLTTTQPLTSVFGPQILCLANRYYKDPRYTAIYMRKNGLPPYPSSNTASAGNGLSNPWSGTDGEYPGVLWQFAGIEKINVYQYENPAVVIQKGGVTLSAGITTYTLDAVPSAAVKRWNWIKQPGNPAVALSNTNNSSLILNPGGTTTLPTGTYKFKLEVELASGGAPIYAETQLVIQ